MTNSKDYYVAIYPNGTSIKLHSLSDLNHHISAAYFLKAHYFSTYSCAVSSRRQDYYRFEIIDIQGAHATISVGDFEIVNIDADSGCLNYNAFNGRDIGIRDKRLGTLHTFRSKTWADNFIWVDVLPFLAHLNELGSYKAYQDSLEIEKLKREIELLTELKNNLQQELNELKQAI